MAKHVSRRQFLRSVAFGAGTLALAACGASEGGQTSTGATTTAGGTAATAAPGQVSSTGSKVDITYWGSFSGNLGEAEQKMVNDFNASQQDVNVNYQFQGSYEETAQKLTAALQARTAPDVSLLSDVWWFKFYLAKALAPLNDLFAGASVDTTDFVDVLLQEGTRKGMTYWVPFARSTPLFYYNKDAWAEAGLPDRGPETWDEMTEWAPKLVQMEGDQIKRAAFAHPGAASYVAWLFQGVVWQFNGSYSDPDFTIRITEPNAVTAGQFYQKTMVDKWATAPKDVQQDFVTGLTASAMLSTGSLNGVLQNAKFNVGTAFLPKKESFGCPTGGSGLAILAGAPAERQQAAMKFIDYCTNTNGTIAWSQNTGYMPVRKSAATDPKMVEFFGTKPNFKTAVDQLPNTKPQDAARVFIPNGDQIIGKGMERILVGGEQVEPVFADVAKTLEQGAAPVVQALKAVEG